MRKLLSGVLVMVMMLSMVAAAVADPFVLEEAGVIIEVPEGMTPTDESDENGYLVSFAVEGNPNLVYAYYIGFVEAMEGKSLEDLTEDEGALLVENIAVAMENATYSIVERDDRLILVVEDGAATQAHLALLLDGWIFDTAVVKTDGIELTEAEIETAVEILLGIEFIDEE